MELVEKSCVPCQGGISPLKEGEIGSLLVQVPGWELVREIPHRLRRHLKFKSFKEAIAFVNRVAGLAESEGHHPNISLHDWNRVTLELTTHKIGGLHENDFILAAKINRM